MIENQIRVIIPQRIEMYHLQIVLDCMLNHQISRLCILEKTMVQV